MTECDYCGAEFEDEDAYLDHLAAEHEGELGRIDRRRVEDRKGSGGGLASGPVVIAAVLGVAVVGVLGAVFFLSSNGGGSGGGGGSGLFSDQVSQPTGVGGAHYHGQITVSIDGQSLDFSRNRYQLQDQAFHFENGNGQRWHGHANGITLEYALETLGIGVTQDKLSFSGTVYDRTDGDTVRYRVNGQEVNPEQYILREGDQVTIVARGG